jgi:hypothetical protein
LCSLIALTPSVAVAEVWEAPNIAQPDGVTDAGEEKLGVVGPVTALGILVPALLGGQDGQGGRRTAAGPRRVHDKAGVALRKRLEIQVIDVFLRCSL